MQILLDAGPLIALFAPHDAEHLRARTFLRETRKRLLTTWPVVTEAWHLLAPGQRITMVRWLKAGGAAVSPFDDEGSQELVEWLEKYRDPPMDLADASLVLLARKAGISDILTFDRRDFLTYRLPGNKRFSLVLDA